MRYAMKHSHQFVLIALCGFLFHLTTCVHAQFLQFIEQTDISIPGASNCAIAWGDYDNDGLKDFIISGQFGAAPETRIYHNTGTGFVCVDSTSLIGVSNGSVAWGDYDNDGRLDVLLTGATSSGVPISMLYHNTVAGFVEDTFDSFSGVSFGSASWGDYDNDGFLDILITGKSANGNGVTMIYHNTGSFKINSPSFTEVFQGVLPGIKYSSAGWSGYDKDGNLDVLLTGRDSNGTPISKIFRYIVGNGFYEVFTGALPGVRDGAVAWGDYDKDGYPDIVLTGYDATNTPIGKIFHNDNGAGFHETSPGSLDGVGNGSVDWGDYDNDGYPDLLLTGMNGTDPIAEIFHNSGSYTSGSSFSQVFQGELTGVSHGAACWGDYDNDGYSDILLTGQSGNGPVTKIYRQNQKQPSGGDFSEQYANAFPGLDSCCVAWGDYDGDGNMDLLMAGLDSTGNPATMLLRNTGTGFSEVFRGLFDGVKHASVAWGDYDGDGLQDIILTGQDKTSSAVTKIYHNTGSGFEEAFPGMVAGVEFGAVAWGDYDNDGLLDILITGSMASNGKGAPVSKIYHNTGYSFEEVFSGALAGVQNSAVAWGDYNNDGNPDILLCGNDYSGHPVTKLYQNTGSGFSEVFVNLPTVSHGSVAWGDYDNDGLPDILITGDSASSNFTSKTQHRVFRSGSPTPISKIYHNTGSGFAEAFAGQLPGISGGSALWGDVNSDGYPDVILTGINASSNPITSIYSSSVSTGGGFTISQSFPGLNGSVIAWSDRNMFGLPGFIIIGKIGLYPIPHIFSKVPKSLSFNGSFNLVTSPIDLVGDELTIEYWFKGSTPSHVLQWSHGGTSYVISGYWDSIPGHPYLHVLSNDGGYTGGIKMGNNLTDGNWHHVAMTWKRNAVNGFCNYLDGKLVDWRNSSDTPFPNVDDSLRFGLSTTGQVAEMKLWNISRTEAEIQHDMSHYQTGDEDRMIGYWHLNGGGTVCRDRSDNANNGQFHGTPVWVTPAVSITVPEFLASPGSLTFNNVALDSTKSSILTVFNNGSGALNISGIALTSAEFSISPSVASIAAGTSAPFLVSCTPNHAGTHLSSVIFSHNAAGSADTLTITGTTYGRAPDAGKALSFNGTDSYLSVGHPANLPTSNTATCEAWVFIPGYAVDTLSGILSWGPCTYGDAGQSFIFGIQNSGLLGFSTGGVNRLYPTIGPKVQANTWNHAAVVVNGNTVQLYLNGQLSAAGVLATMPSFQPGALNIGAVGEPGKGLFKGAMDEVRLWRTARSAVEIQYDMLNSLAGNESGLSGYWRFDEGGGTYTADMSGNGNTGTMVNNPSWITPYPYFTATPVSLNFGLVNGSASATRSITVANTGRAALVITSVSSSQPDFTVTPSSATIPIGTTGQFTITFSPNGNGIRNGVIRFAHNASMGLDSVAVTGRGAFESVSSPYAIQFDASQNQYISIATPNGIPANNSSYTIETWEKADSMMTQGVIGWGDFGPGNTSNVLRIESSALVNTWGSSALSANIGNLAGSWHHIAATYDSATDRRSLYLDGILLAFDQPGVNHIVPGTGVTLGVANTVYFNGLIDMPRIWRRALTAGEIRQAMFSNASWNGIAAAWNFDEGAGTTLHDLTGNGNDGELNHAMIASRAPRIVSTPVTTRWIPLLEGPPLCIHATMGTYEQYMLAQWHNAGIPNVRYIISRIDTATHDTLLLAHLSSADSFYVDYTGRRGRTYIYLLTMINSDGTPHFFSADSGSRIIFAPELFAASNRDYADYVQLTWTNTSAVTDTVQVIRNGVLVGTLPGDTYSLQDTSAIPETLYTYSLIAYDSTGVPAKAVTAQGRRGLVQPVVSASASYGLYRDSVVIRWVMNNDYKNSVRKFKIYRSGISLDSASASSSSYTDHVGHVTVPDTFTYGISVVDTNGRESIKRYSVGGLNILPAPLGVSASDSAYDDHIEVTWSDTSSLVDKFVIYRDRDSIATVSGKATSYPDYDTLGGVWHVYWVRSLSNLGGMSFDSTSRDSGYQSRVLPPTGLTASNGSFEDKVRLSWNSTSTKTNLFNIFRDGTLIATWPGAERVYLDFTCQTDLAHRYIVNAVTAKGIQSAADTAYGRRALNIPGSMQASDGSNEEYVALTWTNTSTIGKGFRIRRSRADSSEMVVLSSNLSISATSFNDSTGQSDTVYRYYVDVADTTGGISYSTAVQDWGSRVLKAPMNVLATNEAFEKKVVVSWYDTSKAEDGYRVYRNGSLIGSTASNATYYIDDRPESFGDSSIYAVAAFDRYGESQRKSAEGSSAILPPLAFDASTSYQDRIQLSWVNQSTIPNRFYEIRRLDLTNHATTPVVWTVSGATYHFTDTKNDGVVAGHLYSYTILTGITNQDSVISYSVPTSAIGIEQAPLTPSEMLKGLMAKGFNTGQQFGSAVTMTDSDAFVSPGNDSKCYLFHISNGLWSKAWDFTLTEVYAHALYPSMAMSKKIAMLGNPNTYTLNTFYPWNHTWVSDWDVFYPGHTHIGASVAVSDTTGFLAAPGDDTPLGGGGTAHGVIYVINFPHFDGTLDALTQLHSPYGNDTIGVSLAANDLMMVAGAVGVKNGATVNAGHVHIWQRSGGGWSGPTTLFPHNPAFSFAPRRFGISVAISQDTTFIAAGSPDENAVYVSDYSTPYLPGQYSYTQCQRILPSDSIGDIGFGTTVAISKNLLLVGDLMGSVYEFLPVGGVWVESRKLSNDDTRLNTQFGTPLAVNGGSGLIGAPFGNGGTGAVYTIFTLNVPVYLKASAGQYKDRVHLSWSYDSKIGDGFHIYRQGQLIKTVAAGVNEYDDYDALPGQPFLFEVAAYVINSNAESPRGKDHGWRSPDGSISGRIMNKTGGGVRGVKITVDPSQNKALLFDGVTGGGSVVCRRDSVANPGLGKGCTFEAWIKPNKMKRSLIVGWWDGEGLANRSNCLSLSPTGLDYYWSPPPGTNHLSAATGDLSGAWHHVAATYNPLDNLMKIYLDGALVRSGVPASPNLSRNRDIMIGAKTSGAPDNFDGQIDEVRVWEYARTLTQIQSALHEALTGQEIGLTAYFTMDQDSGAIIANYTQRPEYGEMAGGVFWSGDHAPLDTTIVTDEEGYFTLPNLRYGEESAVKVIPSYNNHLFSPLFQKVVLTKQNPIQNQLFINDVTSYSISGSISIGSSPGTAPITKVREFKPMDNVLIGNCPEPNVQIYGRRGVEDEILLGITDKNGYFSLSVDPGEYTIRPVRAHHAFVPPTYFLTVGGDTAGFAFQDTTTRNVHGIAGGGCSRQIGTVHIEFSTINGCSAETLAVDNTHSTEYSVNLPAQTYIARVLSVDNVPSNIDRVDVRNFFNGLGSRALYLDTLCCGKNDTTLDFVYHAPIALTLSGLPDRGSCAAPEMRQGTSRSIHLQVTEDYGDGRPCAVDTGSIILYDGIGDRQNIADTIPIIAGSAYYTVTAGYPNLSSGILDEYGTDRSYQKSLTTYAYVTGMAPKKTTAWVIVTGIVPRPGVGFITGTSTPINFLVIHDPPGDHSFASLKKETEIEMLTYGKEFTNKFGGGLSVELENGVSLELVTAPVGVGFVSKTDVGFKFSLETVGGAQWENHTEEKSIFTTEQQYATSSDPTGVGPDADLFLGASKDFKFTVSDQLAIVPGTCQLQKKEVLAYESTGWSTFFAYTRSYIRDVLLPNLNVLCGRAKPPGADAVQISGDTSQIASYIETWQGMLDSDNVYRKAAVFDSTKGEKNVSFSGGSEYEYSSATGTSYEHSEKYTLWFNADLKAGLTWNCPVSNGNLMGELVYEHEDTQIDSDNTSKSTSGFSYTLSDDDPGDYFSVDIKYNPRITAPYFSVRGGASSCPYEPWPDTTGAPIMMRRDNVKLFANPPLKEKVNPILPATFTVGIANQSGTDETRTYQLLLDNRSNYGGAIVKASGIPINNGLTFDVDPGKTQNFILSVERGPVKYRYDNLRLVAGPQCEPTRAGLSDTILISAHFDAPCSDIALDEPLPGWAVAAGDSVLAVTMGEYQVNVSESDSIFEMYAEYRRTAPLLGPWTRCVGVQIPDASILKDSVRTFRTWFLRDLPDGTYELRAVAHCHAGYGYSAVTPGTIDRTPPQVMTHQPANNGVLSYNADISIAFTENIDPKSITAANVKLAYVGLLNPIRVKALSSGSTLVISPIDTLREGANITASVKGLTDLVGNSLTAPTTWTFQVRRTSFHFSPRFDSLARPYDKPGSFTLKLCNGTDQVPPATPPYNGKFLFAKLPSWLRYEGDTTIGAVESKDLTFDINPGLRLDSLYSDSIIVKMKESPSSFRDTAIIKYIGLCDTPDWSADSSAYMSSMTLTALVYLPGNSAAMRGENIEVAAFVGSQVRGVCRLKHIGAPLDSDYAFLNIYSNSAGRGERIRFKVFDPSTCTIYNSVTPSLTYNAGVGWAGTPHNPIRLTARVMNDSSAMEITLNTGWTWFSYNIVPEDSTLSAVMGNVNASPGDIVKSMSGFSQYASSDTIGSDWFGSLIATDYRSSYNARIKNGGIIAFNGAPLQPDTIPIVIHQGWNWIGYLPAETLDVNTALHNLRAARDGEIIMSQNQYAQYIGTGWVGSLTQMMPGKGYRFFSNHIGGTDVLTYPHSSAGSPAIVSSQHHGVATTMPGIAHRSLILHGTPQWSVDPSQFQYNMTVTGMAEIGGIPSVNDSDLVAAFVNDTCRGIAQAIYVDGKARNEFFIMIYSDQPAGETVQFRFYDAAQKVVRHVDEQLRFSMDASQGTVDQPFDLHANTVIMSANGTILLPSEYALWQNYPNPFNPITEIRYDLPERSKVALKIYNTLGQLVAMPVNEMQEAGYRSIRFDAANIASGVYFYRIDAASEQTPSRSITRVLKMVVIR